MIKTLAQDSRHLITNLLEEAGLPYSDIDLKKHQFFGYFNENRLKGIIGKEEMGDAVLLRSLVVKQDYRMRGIADQLVNHLEESTTKPIYLLTTTADGYFFKRGYAQVTREEAPPEVQNTNEFKLLCPDDAVLMVKKN